MKTSTAIAIGCFGLVGVMVVIGIGVAILGARAVQHVAAVRRTVSSAPVSVPTTDPDAPPFQTATERTLTTDESARLRAFDDGRIQARIIDTCLADLRVRRKKFTAAKATARFSRTLPSVNWPAWAVKAGAGKCVVIDNGFGAPYSWHLPGE